MAPARQETKAERKKEKKIRMRRSIRIKTMLTTTLIILCGILLFGAVLTYSMQKLTEDILMDVMQPMAKQSAKAVEANVHLMADRMMTLALALDGSVTELERNVEDADVFLAEARNTYEFYGIGIYHLDGSLQASDGQAYESLKELSWFPLLQETDNLTICDPQVFEDHIGIPMGMPIQTEGETSAYLVGIYKYDVLSDVLGEIRIGQNGMALIINEEGLVIGHPQAEVVREQANIFDLDADASAHDIFNRMLSRETGSAQGKVNGGDAYVAYCPIRGTQWSFAIEVPKSDYQDETNYAFWNTLVVTGLVLIAALVAIFVIMTMISVQMKKAILRIDGLAEGDLGSEVVVRNSGDEVQALSVSLKTTIESMNGYVGEIRRVLDSISNGNLNVVADGNFRGDFVVVKETLTNIINSLNQVMKQISQTAFDLMESAKSMGSQSEELHQAVMNQTEAMDDLNAEVGSIRENLNLVTENTHQTSQRAAEMAEQISYGNRKMEQLKEAMEAIDRNAEDISKISMMIEGIAQQTKILALNASVEAARAGEAGKGFAVVAEEVRDLAGQSAQAAKNTVAMIEKSSTLIHQGVLLTSETSESLKAVRKGSDAVTEISHRLSETVEVQEVSLQEITQRIGDITEITQQNLHCAEDTAEISVELEMESKRLKELLERFRFH